MSRYVITMRVATPDGEPLRLIYEHVQQLQLMPGPTLGIQNHEGKFTAVIPMDQIQSCVCVEADAPAPSIIQPAKPTLAFDKSKLAQGIH